MIKRSLLFLSLTSFLLLPRLGFSQLSMLTFSDAQSIMNNHNHLIKAVEKKEEVHEFELKATKGLRYPKIGLNASALYFDKGISANLNNLRNGVSGILSIPNPNLLGDWNFNLMKRDVLFGGAYFLWPVFTGGKINAGIEAAKINAHIGEKELISTKNQLITELAQRYFQVKLADEAVLVRKQILEGMNRHLYNAKKLEDNGIIAPVERLQADVAVAEADRQYKASLKDASLARVALSNTLNSEEEIGDLITDFFTTPFLQPLEYYQESAIANYPELQKVRLQIELAEQGVKAKKSSYYPTVLALGQTVLVHNTPLGFGDKNDKPWVLGVGLTYPLFEGLQSKNEIRAAKATKESAELYEKKAHADIKTMIEKIYNDLQKQEEQIQSFNVQVNQAEELLRARSLSFSEGLATSLDVVDAEMNLSGILLQKLQARYNYVIDLASLLEYSGLSQEFIQYMNQ
ncbi:TolC family protein [Apibacter muscae]|uniref:TolC family protein n=1 Tax=Apibacter muscae TaxID=2509004 RepID=UPI0011AB91BE|nr:TolC family protein [Apibacter muscae]TWP23310.1 TolC family protein [Apibacter muscae]TWP29204.1 TolC family protein [Apibacter muscae]